MVPLQERRQPEVDARRMIGGGLATAYSLNSGLRSWLPARVGGHAGVGVEEGEFAGGAEVGDDEGSLADTPEAFTLGEVGDLVVFDGSEAEDSADGGDFVVGLVVEDAGGGVAEKSLDESPGCDAHSRDLLPRRTQPDRH